MPPIVEAKSLVKTFKKADGQPFTAVNGVDLTINQGEIFSLLGPNGAGKTTTISMMCGLLRPTSGDAVIAGHSITREPLQAKRSLGVVPQEIALYPSLTARQNLTFFGRLYGLDGAMLSKRVDEVLDFIDLKDRQNDKVDTFSGGMKRRVNIGVGLLHQPALVFMDEPTVGIDPQNRRRILDTVVRLKQDMGMTVLYTSHLMEEVQEISDRVAIIDHGEVIAQGTVDELIQMVGEEDTLIFNVGQQIPSEAALASFQQVSGVTRVDFEAPTATSTSGHVSVHAKRGRSALPDLIQRANEAGIQVFSVEVREPNLEAVFLHLTGRALRD